MTEPLHPSRLKDLVVRTETNKLVTDLVNLDRVRSLLKMIIYRRRFKEHLRRTREQGLSFRSPERNRTNVWLQRYPLSSSITHPRHLPAPPEISPEVPYLLMGNRRPHHPRTEIQGRPTLETFDCVLVVSNDVAEQRLLLRNSVPATGTRYRWARCLQVLTRMISCSRCRILYGVVSSVVHANLGLFF